MSTVVFAAALIIAPVACGTHDTAVGPCYVKYEQPLVTVASATDDRTGHYTFTFGAATYRDTTLVVEAAYARGEGNCPRTMSGGVVLRLRLTPQ